MGRYSHQRTEIPEGYWKASQVYVLTAIVLLAGIAMGYLFHGSSAPVNASSPSAENWTGSQTSTQTGPLPVNGVVELLLQQLDKKPNDPTLLASIGDQYYDNKEYSKAIEYYEKSLKLRPEDVNVRTDMGTAIWYSGDADRAIREYQTSLKYQPTHAQTLFNLGVVEWQGKKDRKAALDLWQKLLSTNPGYPDRQKVEQMMQQVKAEVN